MKHRPTPAEVLEECHVILKKKGADYQNPLSTVEQADYYPHGLLSIYAMIHQKTMRLKSLIETAMHTSTEQPKFESITDSFIDLCNYSAIGASYSLHGIQGQDTSKDLLNRPIPITAEDYQQSL